MKQMDRGLMKPNKEMMKAMPGAHEPPPKKTLRSTRFQVVVMAIVGNYAMVRRKGCVPFVANVRDLEVEIISELPLKPPTHAKSRWERYAELPPKRKGKR